MTAFADFLAAGLAAGVLFSGFLAAALRAGFLAAGLFGSVLALAFVVDRPGALVSGLLAVLRVVAIF